MKNPPNRSIHPILIGLLFLTFALGNALLAYTPLPLEFKILVFILAIVVPFGYSLCSHLPLKYDLGVKEIPLAILGASLLLAFVLRFYRLSDFFYWPTYDDGAHGLFAANMAEKWEWTTTYSYSHHGAMYLWLISLGFKFLGPSLQALYFMPALFSIVAVVLFWAAARKFFPRTQADLFGLLMAYSFGPLLSGRFSVEMSLLLFWQALCLWLLGSFHKTQDRPSAICALFLLGSATGLGFYIFNSWPFMSILIMVAVLVVTAQKKKWSLKDLTLFWIPMVLISTPLFITYFKNNPSRHILRHSFLTELGSGQGFQQVLTSFSYFTVHLWGTWQKVFDYGPVWGGYLNPILGSLFLIGLIVSLKNISSFYSRAWWISLIVLSAPGFLSSSLEMARIELTIPLILLMVIPGIGAVLSQWPSKHRGRILVLLLVISGSLDQYHLAGPYRSWAKPSTLSNPRTKNLAQYEAYEVLKQYNERLGPGLIFTRFIGDTMNLHLNHQGLFIATYSFNAVANPNLDPQGARWAALLVTATRQQEMKILSPGSTWITLAPKRQNGLLEDVGLALFEIKNEGRNRLDVWIRADRRYREFQSHMLTQPDLMEPKRNYYHTVLKDLVSLYVTRKEDVFLNSIWWEKAEHLRVIDPADVSYLAQARSVLETYEELQTQKGPGRLLGSFSDRMSSVLFNSLGLTKSPDPGWFAIAIDVNYRVLLKRLYPQGRFYETTSITKAPGSTGLWWMPLDGTTKPLYDRWRKAQDELLAIDDLQANEDTGRALSESLMILRSNRRSFEGDRLLRSIYGEKTSEFLFASSREILSRSADNDPSRKDRLRALWIEQVNALKETTQEGIPAAHLYDQLGLLYIARKDFPKARESFMKALEAPGNRTQAGQHLKELRTLH